MRAARNSRSHGLSSNLLRSQKLIQDLERRARKIAGDTLNPLVLNWSRSAAEAEWDLWRARQAKCALMERTGAASLLDDPGRPPPEEDHAFGVLSSTISELLKIDRYEQRAASRLDSALKNIVALRSLK